jgi:hypothetical protein
MRAVLGFLAAICLTFAALPASAQLTGDGSLRGQLPETLRASGGVVILLDDAGQEVARALVSSDGRFVFPAVPAGRYTLALADSTGKVVLARVPARAVSGVVTSVLFGGGGDSGTTTSVLQGAAANGLPTALPLSSGWDNGELWGRGGDRRGLWRCWRRCCWWSCHR